MHADQSVSATPMLEVLSTEITRVSFFGVGKLEWRLDFQVHRDRVSEVLLSSARVVLIALTGERSGLLALPIPLGANAGLSTDEEVWREIANLIASQLSHRLEQRTGNWSRITPPTIKSVDDSVLRTMLKGSGTYLGVEIKFCPEGEPEACSAGCLLWAATNVEGQ